MHESYWNSFANIYSRMSQLYELQIATISVWQKKYKATWALQNGKYLHSFHNAIKKLNMWNSIWICFASSFDVEIHYLCCICRLFPVGYKEAINKTPIIALLKSPYILAPRLVRFPTGFWVMVWYPNSYKGDNIQYPFLATLVALHFTPVSN